jgi:hypothetical protein
MAHRNNYRKFKILLLIIVCLLESPIKAQVQAVGESSVFKKGGELKAYYEAIANAQQNAVITYGGNISYNSSEATVNTTNASKSDKDKKNTNDMSFSQNYQAVLTQSVNSAVKTESIIRVDTIKVSNRTFKIRVTGKFEINPNEVENSIGLNISKTKEKVKIAIKENSCQGDVYDYLSSYFNSRYNNFIFSKDEWPLSEEDYLMEINNSEIILKNKHEKPNIILKIYHFEDCYALIKDKKGSNKVFDEIMNDIYLVYVFQSVKNKK